MLVCQANPVAVALFSCVNTYVAIALHVHWPREGKRFLLRMKQARLMVLLCAS